MSEQENLTVRKVLWSEILPWLNLARCFRIAIQFRLLACGAVGVILMLTGWAVLGYMFSGNEAIRPDVQPVSSPCPWLAGAELIGDRPGLFGLKMGVPPGDVAPVLPSPGRTEMDYAVRSRAGRMAALGQYDTRHPYWGIWEFLSAPWRNLFDPNWSATSFTDRLTRFMFLFLCGLWALMVWALLGGVITRAGNLRPGQERPHRSLRRLEMAGIHRRALRSAPGRDPDRPAHRACGPLAPHGDHRLDGGDCMAVSAG
jgi:hypothetical protein